MMINPILRTEMKTDSRRFRFYLLLMIYVIILSVPTLLLYNGITSSSWIQPSSFVAVYLLLACTEAIVLMFVVPALAASSITSERERQTLDILLTTNMSPRQIIYGKMLTVIVKVAMLIICIFPIYAIILFLGGITILDIIEINLYLMLTTVCITAMCIWVSTLVKTSKLANVLAYFIEISLIIGIPIAAVINGLIFSNSSNVEKLIGYGMSISPSAGFGFILAAQLGSSNGALYITYYINDQLAIPGWSIAVVVEILLTILFTELAIKKLNPVKRK